jgi:hypothetical protein
MSPSPNVIAALIFGFVIADKDFYRGFDIKGVIGSAVGAGNAF